MKTISTAAIVALMTASLGLTAIAPASAQETAPAAQTQPADPAPQAERNFRPGGNGPRAGLSGLLNIERGAEAIEIAIVRVSHQLDLTDEQQALLDSLKTDALAAAESFATATEGLRIAHPAAGETTERPDIAQRLENRIALEKAQLAALEAVQPSFVVFFDSLDDEQKAALTPDRPERPDFSRQGQPGQRDHAPGQQGGQRDNGPGQHGGQRPNGPANQQGPARAPANG